MSTRSSDIASTADRVAGWTLLALGGLAGLVLPGSVTAALWTAAAKAFSRGGDRPMVDRLTSATKFGPRVRRGLTRRYLGHPPLARLAY
jgi:hypothetical protein